MAKKLRYQLECFYCWGVWISSYIKRQECPKCGKTVTPRVCIPR